MSDTCPHAAEFTESDAAGRAGVGQASGEETAGEFAAKFTLQPGLGAAVSEFTSLYAEARFGGALCDAFRLRALLQEIRAAAHGK